MKVTEVAYLGPPGTYSHIVCEKRFGTKYKLIPEPTIMDVFRFVYRKPWRRGVVPMESSSGGAISETVDILLANKPHVHIEEELSLEIKIALLGRRGEKVKVVYSHSAPLEHCISWLKRHLPRAERCTMPSTAASAQRVVDEKNAAALGSKRLAELYNLDVLYYPVEADIPYITSFLVITSTDVPPPVHGKTTIAAVTPNKPGGLCTFLETFRDENVNLCRIISRPIKGQPAEYAFLVDIEGGLALPNVKRALLEARKTCTRLRIVGSYPCRRPYKS